MSRSLALLALAVVSASSAAAHEVRPAYLSLRETAPDRFEVLFKVPTRGDRVLRLAPALPDTCVPDGEPGFEWVPGARLTRYAVHCEGGLAGGTLGVVSQFTLLAAISSKDAATITELSRAMIMDRTTLTRNLNPLQKNGWVEVTPGVDKRTKILSLTRSGKKILSQAMIHWNLVQNKVVKTLGKRNWGELIDNLGFTVKRLNPY